jgi:hypothetical protein
MESGLNFVQTPYRTNRRRKMVERIRPSQGPTVIEPSRVRGRPFQTGNPGRPPGSKNKTTRMLEQLVEGEGETLVQKVIDKGKGGDVRCLQYLLDRILPKRRGRPLDLRLPKINSVQDIPAAMAAVMNGLNDGDLTLEEASPLIAFLESYSRVVIGTDVVVRIEKVEAQMKQFKSLKR